MRINALLNKHLQTLALRLAPESVRTRRDYLNNFLRYLRRSRLICRSLTGADIETYLNRKNCCLKMKQDILRGIGGFMQYLVDENILEDNPATGISITLKRRLALPKNIPSINTVRRLFLRLEKNRSVLGLRNRLMLELAYGSGLRRAELAALNCEDVNLTEHTARIKGKGGKERMVPLTGKAARTIARYKELSHGVNGPLLRSWRNKRLHPKNIELLFRQCFKTNAHAFRHACASHLLAKGCGIRLIQDLLGHASLDTTQIYTHLHKGELNKMINRMHPKAKEKKKRS
jgi:integrase/recombinase XerC